MDKDRKLFRIQVPVGRAQLSLPSQNTRSLLAALDDWISRRSEMTLPLLFVLEGPPAVGKSSLARIMLSAHDGARVIDGATVTEPNRWCLDSSDGALHRDARLVIIDDAEFCDQTALVHFTTEALIIGLTVILLVQSRRGIAAALMGNAATGTIERRSAG